MNPRTRRMIRSGLLQKILDEEKNKNSDAMSKQKVSEDSEKEKLLIESPVTQEKEHPLAELTTIDNDNDKVKEKSIDPFIAKELKEIERIPSNKAKSKSTKKTTTKKTTTKKKTGAK